MFDVPYDIPAFFISLRGDARQEVRSVLAQRLIQ